MLNFESTKFLMHGITISLYHIFKLCLFDHSPPPPPPFSCPSHHTQISNSVEDSLAHAHALTNRLGELNREMVDYVAALAEKKASSKWVALYDCFLFFCFICFSLLSPFFSAGSGFYGLSQVKK